MQQPTVLRGTEWPGIRLEGRSKAKSSHSPGSGIHSGGKTAVGSKLSR